MVSGVRDVTTMSNMPSSLRNEQTTGLPDESRSELQGGVASAARTLSGPFQFVGFWSAVALPMLYLPLLAGGFTGDEATTFAVLLAVHAVALVAGHGYRND